MKKKKLTHVDERGKVRMVDTANKPDSDRYAKAEATVRVSNELLTQLKDNTLKKGDAFSAARIAGIQAAKRTAEIIPLCHTLPLTSVSVDFEFIENPPTVRIFTETRTHYNTGVEMEALMAATAAALTIYDMGKAIDRSMTIESIRLLEKRGGRSGHFNREDND